MKPGTPQFKARRERLAKSETPPDPPTIHEAYDESDATYVQLSSMPVHATREYQGTVLVDADERGTVRGIEFVGGGPLDAVNVGGEVPRKAGGRRASKEGVE